MIPPKDNSDFVARMEAVLDIYRQAYDRDVPVVCMDESSKQLVGDVREPLKIAPGHVAKQDYEYERLGVANVFLASEPLAGKRYVHITERKTKVDWAHFMKAIADQHYPQARRIRVVLDNLNTHNPALFYEAFAPQEARRLCERFEFIHTPKHGSWLNMAEIELRVLMGHCLAARIATIEEVEKQTLAWQEDRNRKEAKIDWQFTTADARIKLKRLYPTLST